MSEKWYAKLGFETDPYRLTEPWVTPFEFIVWNREDLIETKRKVDLLLDEIRHEYNTSMLIWGPWRSGKTWLARYIQKELKDDVNIYFVNIVIEQGDPSLEAFYSQFIKKLISSNWLNDLASTLVEPNKFETWRYLFDSVDVSKVLHNLYTQNHYALSLEWFQGLKLRATDMEKIEVKTNLDSLYDKMEVLKAIIRKSQEHYDNFIMCIDQLEGARGRSAKLLNDLIREILSSFYDKFTLILIITMESLDDWYTTVFSDALLQRVRYQTAMEILNPKFVPDFLSRQHEIHRISEWQEPQLLPYNERSILTLIENMEADKRYPRFLLHNCGFLSKKNVTENGTVPYEISESYVKSKLEFINWRLERKGQLRLPT